LFVEGGEMGSQWRAGVRSLTAESDTVLLTDDSLRPLIDDIADRDTAATNTNDAVEWLTRVMRCALHGQGDHDPES
jgi:hypothetical protein